MEKPKGRNNGIANLINQFTIGKAPAEVATCEACGWNSVGLNLMIAGKEKTLTMPCPNCGKPVVVRRKGGKVDESEIAKANAKSKERDAYENK